MLDRPLSRPIRKVPADFTDLTATFFSNPTKIAAITVTPLGGDVVADFRNGATGEILWSIEADNAAGSHSISFGAYPLFFTQGIVVDINNINFLHSIQIAVVEPQASGTV